NRRNAESAECMQMYIRGLRFLIEFIYAVASRSPNTVPFGWIRNRYRGGFMHFVLKRAAHVRLDVSRSHFSRSDLFDQRSCERPRALMTISSSTTVSPFSIERN